MRVTLLYFDGCPNWRTAEARVREALERLGRDEAAVTRRRVSSDEEAEALSFRGSPTILIDGRDPFGDPSAPAGLSCRVYRGGDGMAGAPSVEQLVEVFGERA